MGRIYVNNFSTSTNGAITDSATTIVINSATGLPVLGSGEYYYLTLGSGASVEIVKVTARSTFTLTVVRAQEGTTGVAWASGTAVEMRATADSFTQKQDQIANATDVINFGDAVSLELPNNATATLSAAGQICLDTSVTDYADGVLCYRAGSTDYGVVAVPKSDLASPTGAYVVTYDATTDQFKLAAASGGGTYTGTANQIDVTGTVISLVDSGTLPGAGGWVVGSGGNGSRGSNAASRIRYNTSTGYMEFNDGGSWNSLLSTYLAVTADQGGTGRTSHTAYAVICGGTTSTAAQQSIASVGVSGAKLTSNGAGALPTMKGGKSAFYAFKSADQTIADSTFTKITYDSESFDTGGMATTDRYTPTIEGYYLITAQVTYTAAFPDGGLGIAYIYKNGSSIAGAFNNTATAGGYNVNHLGSLVYCNGSTDYIEIYTYHVTGSSKTIWGSGGSTYNYFSAVLMEPV